VTTPDDIVTMIATRPLTHDEAWRAAKPGTLLVFADGELRACLTAREPLIKS